MPLAPADARFSDAFSSLDLRVSLLLVLLAANNPKQAFLGVLIVALGWPVYRLLFRR